MGYFNTEASGQCKVSIDKHASWQCGPHMWGPHKTTYTISSGNLV